MPTNRKTSNCVTRLSPIWAAAWIDGREALKQAGIAPLTTDVDAYLDVILDLPWNERDEERLERSTQQPLVPHDVRE